VKLHTIFLLGCITLTGVILCALPIFRYTVWGSDTGEYYYLTSYLTENGSPIHQGYEGWGEAYPCFPGFFFLVSAISLLTGLGTLASIILSPSLIIIPSILLFFLIARRVFDSDLPALLASGFLSVVMPHLYTVSHPMPGSLGDTLLITGLLTFLILTEDRRAWYLLIPISCVLIITHHLSSYIFLLVIIGGLILRELSTEKEKRDHHRIKTTCLFTGFFYLAMIIFWFVLSPEFKRRVLSTAIPGLTPETLAILGLMIIGLLPVILIISPRIPFFRKTMPSPGEIVLRVSAIILILVIIVFWCIYLGVPATTIRVSAESVLFFLPMLALIIPVIIGSGSIELFPQGKTAFGWFAGVAVSLLAGVITGSIALSPYRHAEYLMVFLAILFAAGWIIFFHAIRDKRRSIALAGVCIVLMIANIPVAYPPQEVMLGFEEGIHPQEWSGLTWAGESTPVHAVYASDHRLSSMLFGIEGKYATWDTTPRTFHEENFSRDVMAELASAGSPFTPRRVEYILISDVMKQGVALDPNAPARPMSENAAGKFMDSPFITLYDNGFTRIIMIDWGRT